MKHLKSKKMNNVVVFVVLMALLVTPTMALADGENPYGFEEIIIESEVIIEEEVVIEGEMEIEPSFYIPPPPMPGEEEGEPPEELFLSVSQDSWNPGPEASRITIQVTSNDTWGGIFPEPSDWLTIPLEGVTTQVGNGSFEIRVTENTSTEPRTTQVSIGGQGGTPAFRAVITVTQQGAQEVIEDFLTLSPESWNPGADADSTTIQVSSNTDWRVQFVDDTWLWVTDIVSGYHTGGHTGSFQVHVETNLGGQRTGTIILTGGGITSSVTVTQQGAQVEEPFLLLSRTFWNLASIEDSTMIDVRSNVSWTATSNDPTWLLVSPESGEDNGVLVLTALANEGEAVRTGTITVTGGGVTETITVTQEGRPTEGPRPHVYLSEEELTFTAAADSEYVFVVANVHWPVPTVTTEDGEDWLTVDNVYVNEFLSGQFRVNVDVNTGPQRRGTVTVAGGGIIRTVTVTQMPAQGPVLIVSPLSWEAASAGDETSKKVVGNVPWTATSNNPTWLSVYPGSGNGDGSLKVVVEANDREEARSGSITVTGGGITHIISVSQLPRPGQPGTSEPEFFLSEEEWITSYEAASRTIVVTSHEPWWRSSVATEDGGSWLTTDQFTDSWPEDNSGSFRINVEVNTGGQRRGIITITNGEENLTLTVIQRPARGPTLIVSPLSWEVGYARDETTKTVSSNVSWTATSNHPAWLSVRSASGTGDGTFRVVAEANDREVERQGSITVTGGGITHIIRVTQEAASMEPVLTLSKDLWRAAHTEDETTINVTSNVSWTATSDSPRWLSVLPASGNGNGILRIIAEDNLRSGVARTGVITISGGGITQRVTVHQGATMLSISQATWLASYTGDEITIDITANIHWTATNDSPGWLSIQPARGYGNGHLRMVAEPNTSLHARTRTARITIAGGGITHIVTVTQGVEEMLVIDFWYCYTNRVGFFRGDINVYSSVLGDTGSNFETYFRSGVAYARSVWGNALGVPIGESSNRRDAQILAYGGSRREMEARSGWRNSTAAGWARFIDISHYTRIALESGEMIEVRLLRRTEFYMIDFSECLIRQHLHHNADFYIYLAIHEMGHALGYMGHSPNGIMAGVNINVLSENEVRHLRQIYDLFR